MKKIQILHSIDDKGKNIAKVPLSNSDRYATLYDQDLTELLDLGVIPRWNLSNDGRVIINIPGRNGLSVARLITDATSETVGYLNGDRTDLRRENLVMNGNRGNASLRARDLIIPTARLNNRIEIEHVSTVRPISAGSVMT